MDTVADNGPGIEPRNRTRIFEPYFSTKKGGTCGFNCFGRRFGNRFPNNRFFFHHRGNGVDVTPHR